MSRLIYIYVLIASSCEPFHELLKYALSHLEWQLLSATKFSVTALDFILLIKRAKKKRLMCIGNRMVSCPCLPVTEKFPTHGSFSAKNKDITSNQGHLVALIGTYWVLGICFVSSHFILP